MSGSPFDCLDWRGFQLWPMMEHEFLHVTQAVPFDLSILRILLPVRERKVSNAACLAGRQCSFHIDRELFDKALGWTTAIKHDLPVTTLT